MATGVTPHKKITKKKLPFFVDYDGKEEIDSVLSFVGSNFDRLIWNNGNSENKFFFGDNLEVLSFLVRSGYRNKVKLVYIDPPFATASDFLSRSLKHAYSDNLVGGEYIEFIRKRVIFIYQLLMDEGTLYLHLDGTMAFAIKLILDEIFGAQNCRAFITRKKCSTKNYTKKTFGNVSDYIMVYTKSSQYTWNRPFIPWDEDKIIEQYPYLDSKTGRRYKKVPIHAPGVRNGETGKPWRGMLPPPGKHWQYTPEKLDELDKAGEIYWSATGNPRRMVFCDQQKGIPRQDIWLDFRDSINQSQKTTGYPTEKNYDMLKMIVETSSNEGDIVLDCFAGSGTTLAAAYDLGRQWIGVDNSIESLKAIFKRFTLGLDTYGDYVISNKHIQQPLFNEITPCVFSIFTEEKNFFEIENFFQHNNKSNRF